MVGLEGVGPRDVVVWSDGCGHVLHMRCNIVIVFFLGQTLELNQLRLDRLLPLRMAKCLRLRDSRSAILDGVVSRGCQHGAVRRLVVGFDELDIGCRVCIVVRFKVWRNGMLDLEVRLTDPRRGFVAEIEGRWAPEKDTDDGIPAEESVEVSLERNTGERDGVPGGDVEGTGQKSRPPPYSFRSRTYRATIDRSADGWFAIRLVAYGAVGRLHGGASYRSTTKQR